MVMAVAMAIIIVAIAVTMIVAMTTAFFFIKIFFNCVFFGGMVVFHVV